MDPIEKLRQDAGLEHRPTPLTYEMRLAMSGEGEWAYQWKDKPHRLIYTLCTALEDAEFHLETAKDALANAEQQIEYLHEKFKPTGSGNNALTKIDIALTAIHRYFSQP